MSIHPHIAHKHSPAILALLALGVVFGDIGTSPLYALKETFFGHYRLAPTPENVLGALSLFFWSLLLIICVKYIGLIMKADNEHEGGVLALLALLKRNISNIPTRLYACIAPAMLVGTALLYGDGIITPAISVLSAVEGLAVATPAFKQWVVPVAIVILLILFSVQRRGTSGIGKLFGPVMLIWFGVLVALAVPQLVRQPGIFWAIYPLHGIRFLWYHGANSFWILGAVVLCVTGGEALYADMGHFGRKAITRAWFSVAYPALTLNYFGQGARLLNPAPIPHENLFYALAPHGMLIPLVALATVATVIASQALISGSYSLTQQAMALGVLPRLRTIHTNPSIEGQIYMPFVNWSLFVGCVALVIGFGSSGALAAAYGIAVTGTMAVTTAGFYVLARHVWNWRWYYAVPVCLGLIAIDLAFFSANSLKFFQGGYVPIAIAIALFGIMWIWQWGKHILARAHDAYAQFRTMRWLLAKKAELHQHQGRLHGGKRRDFVENDRAFVFLSSHPVRGPADHVPIAIRVYLKRHGAFPHHTFILTIVQEKVPHVHGPRRYEIHELGNKTDGSSIMSIIARFGFMETPDVPTILHELKDRIEPEIHRCAIETGKDRIVIDHGTPFWLQVRTRIFRTLLRYASPAYEYFGLRAEAGQDETSIPVKINGEGAHVMIPETAFDPNEEYQEIDPDTKEKTELKPVPLE